MAFAKVYGDEWTKHDGRIVKIDGMNCKIRVRIVNAVYPYPHESITVEAEPTAAAKRSKKYRSIKERLGDDWLTDILESDIETQCSILEQLSK